jgi:uncharacterized protein (DUF1501 family)
MERRNFLRLTATTAGGFLLLPNFLRAQNLFTAGEDATDNVLIFIQLNGGNDGLNTFIPYDNPLYYDLRPKIGIAKDKIVNPTNGMGFHPALKDFGTMAQEGNLSVIQNVGYPNPNRSHFRSQEIWQTASDSQQFLTTGWLGRFMDIQCKDQEVASLNIDGMDNLALKAISTTSITVKDFNKIKNYQASDNELKLSDNPQLDFMRKLQYSSIEGMVQINKALQNAQNFNETYADNALAENLKWMSKLIKGGLDSKIYYTSFSGFDTHNNQIQTHQKQLTVLNDALFSFYSDMKQNKLLNKVTVVVFSEFGRRVKENGTGTDHGTAGPMFIIGGSNKGQVLGKNPDLSNLDNGDLIYENDFRSVYAALLRDKFNFNPQLVNISTPEIKGLF